MTMPRESPPPTWDVWEHSDWRHAGDDIYYLIMNSADGQQVTGNDVLVYHWHTPAGDEPRWMASRCGLHTVQQVDPLTLSPSLACEDGCPSHGFLENGTWRSV